MESYVTNWAVGSNWVVFEDSSPVERFFRNGVCSFRSKSMKIRTRLTLLLLGSLINFHTFLFFLRKRMVVEPSLQPTFSSSSFRVLPKYLVVEIWWLTISFSIYEGLYRRIWSFDSSFDLSLTACSLAKNLVEIVKWLGCISTFIEA